MKKFKLSLSILGLIFCLFNFYGCNNNIIRAGEKIADLNGNYKANRYIRLYCDSIYSKENIENIYYLSDINLTYGEKTLILEDLFNNFITGLGYTGKRVIFKPINGDKFYSIINDKNEEVCYIPIKAFKELPFDTLPFVSLAVKDNKKTNYYLNEKTSFIKKLEGVNTINYNPYLSDKRAIIKEDINLNTLEVLNLNEDQGVSLVTIKKALIVGGKF